MWPSSVNSDTVAREIGSPPSPRTRPANPFSFNGAGSVEFSFTYVGTTGSCPKPACAAPSIPTNPIIIQSVIFIAVTQQSLPYLRISRPRIFCEMQSSFG